MKATLKNRITGQLKFLGFMAIALWMVAVTGCKKHEILEPKPKAHYEKGEDKDNSANQRLGVHSTDSKDDGPASNSMSGSDDNDPPDDMITDHDGNDDDGDDEGSDGDTKPVIDKDGNDDDDDGENNRITDKDSTDDDSDGEGLKQGRD